MRATRLRPKQSEVISIRVILTNIHLSTRPCVASLLCLLVLSAVGCDLSVLNENRAADERQQMLDAIAKAERDAEGIEPPKPNISLATPPGWTREEPQALPPEDDGFTVAYEHESGLSVTLYQFTRGLNSIPSDVNSEIVQEEMRKAQSGIEQAVEFGYWEAAKQVDLKNCFVG